MGRCRGRTARRSRRTARVTFWLVQPLAGVADTRVAVNVGGVASRRIVTDDCDDFARGVRGPARDRRAAGVAR